MKLTELISALNILDSRGEMEADISEIIVDSRKSGPGRMFVCIDGYTTDGHRFIGDAVKNGISALLVTKMPPRDLIGDIPAVQVADTRLALAQVSDKLHSHPSGRLNLIGITGTKGKTTTSYMLRAIYTAAQARTGLIGTIQNMIGEEVLHTDRTTPEANELQSLLDEMTRQGIGNCIMEVSSQGLHLNRVACCKYRAAIFTNLSRDHIGPSEHADMEDYANAKAKLFTMSKIAVLNQDNP